MNEFNNTPRNKVLIPFDRTDQHALLTEGTYELVMSTKIKVGKTECGYLVAHPGLAQHGFLLHSRLYEREYE
jgi:hypothetical protein